MNVFAFNIEIFHAIVVFDIGKGLRQFLLYGGYFLLNQGDFFFCRGKVLALFADIAGFAYGAGGAVNIALRQHLAPCECAQQGAADGNACAEQAI